MAKQRQLAQGYFVLSHQANLMTGASLGEIQLGNRAAFAHLDGRAGTNGTIPTLEAARTDSV
jgi:hypothetical protein